MATLNLNNVPEHVKTAIVEHYADCPSLKELAASLGITLSRLHNIAHVMRVPRSMEARSRAASEVASRNRHRFVSYLNND